MRRREVGWKWCPGHNPSFVLVFNVPNVLVVSHHSFTPSHFVVFFFIFFLVFSTSSLQEMRVQGIKAKQVFKKAN